MSEKLISGVNALKDMKQDNILYQLSLHESIAIYDYIEQLQQENKELKDDKEIISKGFHTAMSDMCKYQHILNELESWLEEGAKEESWIKGDIYWNDACEIVLDKLKELKGSDQ